MSANLPGFFVVAIVVIVTPGPDTALTVRNSLVGGWRGGVLTALGVAAGQGTWALATSVGVAPLLAASEPVFLAVKFAGAAYLMFLGLQSFRAALGTGTEARGAAFAMPPVLSAQASVALRQGVISNLTNPKMAVFFPALLPQFVPEGSHAFAGLFALGLLFSAMTLLWLTAYALAVAKAGDVLGRASIRRVLEAGTGVVLVGLGLRLAMERR